jgi:hypothetical protein
MVSYISAYRLCHSFDFMDLLNEKELHSNDIHPMGDYVVVDSSLQFLTEHFPHLTKNQMLLLGKDHVIDFIPGAQKEVYCNLL